MRLNGDMTCCKLLYTITQRLADERKIQKAVFSEYILVTLFGSIGRNVTQPSGTLFNSIFSLLNSGPLGVLLYTKIYTHIYTHVHVYMPINIHVFLHVSNVYMYM